MLPRNRFRRLATTAVLVVGALPLTAAASPASAPPVPALPVDGMAATFDRAGGAAFVGGIAMVAVLFVVGVLAVVAAARTLLAAASSGSAPSANTEPTLREADAPPLIPAPREPAPRSGVTCGQDRARLIHTW